MYEMYKPLGTPMSKLVPVTYEFIEPQKLAVQKPNGQNVLVGYGLGEKIDILEPDLQYLVASYEPRSELVLSDGSVIKNAENVKLRMVHRG